MKSRITKLNKPNNFTVTLPDGTEAHRRSDHNYQFVAAIHYKDKYRPDGVWFATWHSTEAGARSSANQWKNCPSAKDGSMTELETQIIQIRK